MLFQSLIKMLQEKKFFKFFWFIIRICGLQSHKFKTSEKVRAFLLFVLLYVVSFTLLILEMITTDSVEDRIKGIQTMPTFIIMFIDLLNFERKSKEMEKLFDALCDLIKESGEEKLFENCFKSTLKMIRSFAIFASFSVTANIILFLVTGKSGIPVYIPKQRILFYLVWLIQSAFSIYCGLLLGLLDGFMLVCLSVMRGFTQVLNEKFKKAHLNETSFKACVNDHLKFKR